MLRAGGLWWGVVAAAACNSGFPPVLGTSVEIDSGAAGELGTVPIDAGVIDIPATSGSWQADSDVGLDGTGSGSLAAMALQHGVGTITFESMSADARSPERRGSGVSRVPAVDHQPDRGCRDRAGCGLDGERVHRPPACVRRPSPVRAKAPMLCDMR